MKVIYKYNGQVHPSIDYNIEYGDGFYLFDNKPIKEAHGLFWIENAGHADSGMFFLNDIIEDHQKKNKYRRTKLSYTSCGETLDLEFFPEQEVQN